MKKKEREQQKKLKTIINDHWKYYRENVLPTTVPKEMTPDIIEQVEKYLGCGDPRNGYRLYRCWECGNEHIVGFSCKSRFCTRCGKVYIDKWVEKQVENILDVSHRHLVFTMPKEFRGLVYWHREILKEMCDGVAEVIRGYFKEQSKKAEYEVGVITVVHTFGRDLGFNPHIHALIPEGALDKYKQWKDVGYISYDYLRAAWQKVLLDIFDKKFKENQKVQNQIRKYYNNYQKGFYVNAKTRMKNARGAACYIGRYLARPAIAEYRIIEYDGEKVRFWYNDHKTQKRVELTISAIDFIGRLLMHIPKKHFKMVRRYGLYRRDFNKRAQKIVALWQYMKKRQLKLIIERKKTRSIRWRERIIQNYGKDPIECKRCGGEMELWEIWDPKYDFIFHAEYTDEKGRYIRNDRMWREDPRIERRKMAREFGSTIPFPRGQRRVV